MPHICKRQALMGVIYWSNCGQALNPPAFLVQYIYFLQIARLHLHIAYTLICYFAILGFYAINLPTFLLYGTNKKTHTFQTSIGILPAALILPHRIFWSCSAAPARWNHPWMPPSGPWPLPRIASLWPPGCTPPCSRSWPVSWRHLFAARALSSSRIVLRQPFINTEV